MSDLMDKETFDDIKKHRAFTKKTLEILYDLLVIGLPVAEITKKYEVSRQFVSLSKTSFLEGKKKVVYQGLLNEKQFNQIIPFAGRYKLEAIQAVKNVYLKEYSIEKAALEGGYTTNYVRTLCRQFHQLYKDKVEK